MVKYSNFRDELKWYFNESDNKIQEVTQLLVGEREDFNYVLEEVEQKLPNLNRGQELIGQASFVDREDRRYSTDSRENKIVQLAIYDVEDVKSKIVVSKSKGHDMAGQPFYLYDVHPTSDVENKIEDDILSDDYEYERVR